MARRYIIGFEYGDLSELSTAGSGVIESTTVRSGAYSEKFVTAASVLQSRGPTGLNLSHGYFKAAFCVSSVATPSSTTAIYQLFYTESAGAVQLCEVQLRQLSGSGAWEIHVVNAAGSTVSTTSTAALVADAWYVFEFDLTIGAGTGALKVCRDGIEEVSLTSQGFTANNIDRIGWGGYTSGAQSRNFFFDDIECDDAELCGLSKVIARQPATGGTPTSDAWDKSTGTDAGALLDDTPFSATEHIRSALAVAIQTANIATFASTQTGHGSDVIDSGDTIKAAKVGLVAKTAFTDAIAIQVIGTPQAGAVASGANVTLTPSTAPIAGDVVVVCGGHFTRASTPIGPSTSGYNALLSPVSTNNQTFGVWAKVMGITPDTTVVCQGSGNAADAAAYACIVLRQTRNNVIIDIAVPAAATGSSTNPNPPTSGVIASAGTCVLAMAASQVLDAAPGTQTNYTQGAANGITDTNPCSVALSYRLGVAAAVNEDPPAWSAWTTGQWAAATVCIRRSTDQGNRFNVRRIIGGVATNTAQSILTTSDALYESEIFTASVANLNSAEIGTQHGGTSARQDVEDAWLTVSYLPFPIAAGVGDADGTGAAAATGAATVAEPGSAAGTGAATATGRAITPAVAAATAIGRATAEGESFDFLIPDGDITLDGWTDQASGVVNIFQAIDEVVTNDADFVQSPAVGGTTTDFKVRLYKNAVQIVEWTHSNISASFTEVEQTLSGAEVAAIGTFQDLFIEFDDNSGSVYRFGLADAGYTIDEPVTVTYRYRKLVT